MNKSEITHIFANKMNLPVAAAERYMAAVLEAMEEGLLTDGKLTLSDFGTFTLSTRKAFVGKNPRDGSTIQVPSVKVPVFKVGKGLKARINES
jgi:nucleoid DNA-binding protein